MRLDDNLRNELPAGGRASAGTLAGEQRKRKPVPAALLIACDVLLIAAAFGVFSLFHFILPQAYAVDQFSVASHPPTLVAALPGSLLAVEAGAGSESTAAGQAAQPVWGDAVGVQVSASATPSATTEAATRPVTAASPTSTAAPAATATPSSSVTVPALSGGATTDLGGAKFADRFTSGQVIATANSYKSASVNVTLTKTQKDGVSYYIEDVYIRNIENLRTAFAQNTYGKAITAWPLAMAQQNGAIAAINGDYYGTGTIGVVIRNGKLYSDRVDGDVLVLFYDGTMKVYPAAEFDAQQVMAAGAYQAWSFGPSLLSSDGTALTGFRSGISGVNPRTAIGYYEPGHYVFVVVDGRQPGYSNGMTLAQLAALFEDLGCKAAYNLDGGQTSQMTFGSKLVNQPTQGGRMTSDIIYIGE